LEKWGIFFEKMVFLGKTHVKNKLSLKQLPQLPPKNGTVNNMKIVSLENPMTLHPLTKTLG